MEKPKGKTLWDFWILKKLDNLISTTTQDLEDFCFSPAGERLRDFTWNDLADWYLEVTKIESVTDEIKAEKAKILNFVLNTILKLWHPYMPFVTEAIWREAYGKERLLMAEKWPTIDEQTPQAGYEEGREPFVEIAALQSVITTVRALRSDYKIEPSKEIAVTIICDKEQMLLDENAGVIRRLARIESLTITADESLKPAQAAAAAIAGVAVYINLEGTIDTEKERARLEKEIAHVEPYVAAQEKKLANKNFTDNAPQEVIAEEKKKLEEAKEKLQKYTEQLKSLA